MADPGDFDKKILRADGPFSGGENGAAQLQKKKADVDLQALDDRLRRAVLDGDVTYVQGRLGDRKLSEAEALLLIRAKQEHEEKVAHEIAAQQTTVRTNREEDVQEVLQTLFYNNNLRQTTATAGRAGGSDGFVMDSNGQRYYANFGYDAQGNYNTSFGEKIDRNGIMRDPDGGVTDLRRGIYTKGNDFFSEQSGEALTQMDDGTYVLSRKGKDGKNVILERNLSEEEAERHRERMRREAAVLSPEKYQELLARQAAQDQGRPNPTARSSAETTNGPSLQEDHITTRSPGGSNKDPAIARDGGGHVGSIVGSAARAGESVFTDVRAQMELERQNMLGREDVRRMSRQTRNRTQGSERTSGRSVTSAIAGNLTETVAPIRAKDGSYVDKRDGFHAADGSYLDYKKNLVDADGNLWLGGDKSGKPAFAKRDGVDYKELLMARAEGPDALKKWMDADPARALAVKDVNAALNGVDNLFYQRSQASSIDNWVYRSRASTVDKDGNIWIGGELRPHTKSGGADYIDLLKKAEQGKIDEWKATGTLTPEEIKEIKESILANEDNLRARGWNLDKDLKGLSNSRFVTPASPTEQKDETPASQTAAQKRNAKANTVNP